MNFLFFYVDINRPVEFIYYYLHRLFMLSIIAMNVYCAYSNFRGTTHFIRVDIFNYISIPILIIWSLKRLMRTPQFYILESQYKATLYFLPFHSLDLYRSSEEYGPILKPWTKININPENIERVSSFRLYNLWTLFTEVNYTLVSDGQYLSIPEYHINEFNKKIRKMMGSQKKEINNGEDLI